MNTFGNRLRLTTFGESHGVAMGGVLDGFPSQFSVDFDFVQRRLADRAPQSASETARREPDRVEWLSGILDGLTLGTPIAFIIRNREQRSADYSELVHVYRPSHADLAYQQRYGIRDPRGGGRASGRETVSRVVAGALAEQWLRTQGITIDVTADIPSDIPAGDSAGGEVRCVIRNVKAGVGDPVFGKVQSSLSSAILSIPACHGFSYGSPVQGALGSHYNDQMEWRDGRIHYLSNHAGGILGGITTGQDIEFRACFKPTPSISLLQHSATDDGRNIDLSIKGRHDHTVVRRAAAVVRSMAALTIMDYLL